MMILAYVLTAGFIALDVWLAVRFVEYFYCAFFRHQPPFIPANEKMRAAVADEILSHYGRAARVYEIGAGYGGLARYVARRCDADVVGIENMPFCAAVSKCAGLFCRARCSTVWADAFAWLRDAPPADIAIAYLGPKLTPRLADYADRFDVLISLGFELPGARPVRVVDVCAGNTIYGGKKYPHRLYVYELQKKQKDI